MEKKPTQANSFFESGKSTNGTAKQQKATFGENLPTYSEMEEIYFNEVRRRSNHEKVTMMRLSGLKEKDFVLRLKKINKKKGKVL